jgi:uncharacterized protein
LTLVQLLAGCGIGLFAGVLGGLAGVGGSMIMLPGLHLMFGEPTPSAHHLYMAAAMTVNIAVSIPAALRHHRHKAVRTDLLRPLVPITAVAMVIGVLIGNLFQGDSLRLALAGFLIVYCLMNIRHVLRRHQEPLREHERTSRGRLALAGAASGFVGGVLGLGGGVILVPILQTMCKVPLRQAIATSSAVICITAVIGAGAKLLTLDQQGESAAHALMLVLAMAPAAVLGGTLGAKLTHALPLRMVRVVITVLLLLAAAKLMGVGG